MKKVMLFIIPVILLASCKNTWNQDDKDSFYQACTDEAVKWAGSPEKAKTYCDCVLGKMMTKYPHEDDALEHIAELAKDTALINCREQVVKP
jgi:hypothetical protein